MSLVNTLMQPLRAQYQGQLDKNEVRPSRYGAWDFFNKDNAQPTGIFNTDLRAKIKKSFGNSVQVPVMDNNSANITIGNVRSCVVADSENTSQLVTLTFVTYVFGFTMYPSAYENNDIARQEDFNRKMAERLIKFAATLDTQCVTTLESAKNQFWTGITSAPYGITSNAMQVTQAQKNDFYNNIDAIMNRMDFYGDPNIITSPHGKPMVRRLQNQGAGNDVNQQFQLAPYEWSWTNRITPGAGVESSGYIVQSGTVAIETRLDHDARLKHNIGESIVWDTVNIPLPGSGFGIEMGSFYRKDCADGSSLHSGTVGNTATLRESFQFSVDVCYATAYNSAIGSRYNPIIKFEISNS